MKKLEDLFKEINLSVFCANYDLSYDYVRKVFKGTYELSEEMEQKLLDAYGKYLDDKQKIYHS